jgi:menaquinol-cytochrome c reductase cytochrome b/c subunit
MTEIPESLLRRSAEAKAKALGLPVEQVLAEMKGEAPPTPAPSVEPEPAAETEATAAAEMEESAERSAEIEEAVEAVDDEPAPKEEVPAEPAAETEAEVVADTEADVPPAPPTEAPPIEDSEEALTPPASAEPSDEAGPETAPPSPSPAELPPEGGEMVEPAAAAVTTAVEDRPTPEGDGAGDGAGSGNGADGGDGAGNGAGKVAAVVSTRPTVPPKGTPEGVRTQRLLTVVKARAIQTVKAEPTDKVNTWPHLMLMEFGALLAITGLVVIMSVVIHSPLLDPANFNATPNPSKAPWYFLGLQELLSYFDPQIAGVTVPTITGIIGFMIVPFVDKNPSTRPSDRKFAIALYSVFLAGAATLTIFGVLFRGLGFNFSYPWKDGVYFDDLKDWVQFE